MTLFVAIIISLCIGSIFSILTYLKKDKAYKIQPWNTISSILRGLTVATIVFLILAPTLRYMSHEDKKPIILWLQDNTASIPLGLKADTSRFRDEKASLVEALKKDYELVEYQFGETLEKSDKTDFSAQITHLDYALQNATNRYVQENLGAIILASDGIFNRGSDPSFSFINKKQAPLLTLALGDTTSPQDMSIQRVYTNKVVTVGNDFEIGFDIKFSRFANTHTPIHLLQNGQTIRTIQHQIDQDFEVLSQSFTLTAQQPGIQHFQLSIPHHSNDVNESNNTFDVFIEFISNDIKVLVVNNGAHPDIGFIQNALQQAKGFKIDIAPPQTLPQNFAQYDVLILHQPQLSAQAWKSIADAQIPQWHILGTQTPPLQLELIKTALKLQAGSGRASGKAGYTLVPQFNLFKLPIAAQDVMKKLPPLDSRVSAIKGTSLQEVFLSQGATDIWLFHTARHWAITAGEGIWRWGIYEFKETHSHQITHELIQQTLQSLKKPRLDKVLNVFLNKKLWTDQEHIAITAEVRNANAQLVNTPDVVIKIQDQEGHKQEFTFERMGSSYHLLIPPLQAGQYLYSAHTILDGKTHVDEGQFVIENIPLEEMNLQADFQLMYNLAAQHKGKMYTLDNAQQILQDLQAQEEIRTIISSKPIQAIWIDYKWIFFIIIALLTMEWVIRKYFGLQ